MREKKIRRVGTREEDPWVRRAWKFQAKLAKCNDDLDRWDLMEDNPDLYCAYLIHSRGGGDEKHPLRYVVEARLLAGQTPE